MGTSGKSRRQKDISKEKRLLHKDDEGNSDCSCNFGPFFVQGEEILIATWPAWIGRCVDSRDRDQNTGTIRLGGQFRSHASCLSVCKKIIPRATGCEFHTSGSCTIHTRLVNNKGDGTNGYTCNVFQPRRVNTEYLS
eukprot:TRINITY_DN4142_c0_g1_i1.p1 TRINITY_DN4142_c0_g1~~TRINITY_DN4142_c0_g1_i1.p1  ORF type:complete len:137 (-),score=3.55 TRINITY_DN4142_c0_g1_i1:81-491(-)